MVVGAAGTEDHADSDWAKAPGTQLHAMAFHAQHRTEGWKAVG